MKKLNHEKLLTFILFSQCVVVLQLSIVALGKYIFNVHIGLFFLVLSFLVALGVYFYEKD